MEGYALSGDLRSAETVMDSALDAGIPPNVVMFTILIVGHARLGHPERAMQTFQGMLASGIRPDVAAVDAIASAYFAVGAYRIAKRVLLVLWRHLQPPPEGMQSAPLERVAMTFRARHANRNPDDRPIPLSKLERNKLREGIKKLLKSWKIGRRPRRENQI